MTPTQFIYGLVLAGGRSFRMQQDKASLKVNGIAQHLRTSNAMRPHVERVYVSARPDSAFLGEVADRILFDDQQSIGPAAALLRAHRQHPLASWLIVACDFPNIDASSVQSLLQAHAHSAHAVSAHGLEKTATDLGPDRSPESEAQVTCYIHPDGTREPLFAIWNAAALARLKTQVSQGIFGPAHALARCQVQVLSASDPRWLINANTPEEWARATLSYGGQPMPPTPPVGKHVGETDLLCTMTPSTK